MARIVIASGGTGGHFYPGFVLGLELRRRSHEVLYLVRRDDPALPRLEANDLPSLPLDLVGMPRRPGVQALGFLWKMARALGLLSKAYRSWKPQAVVGMGAYLSFPAVVTAWSRGIPAMVHESNRRLGLANRMSMPFVRTLCQGLPLEGEGAPQGVLTGTPVREGLWTRRDPAAARRELGLDPECPAVLVFGGSQGAQALNRVLPAALAEAAKVVKGLQALHLSGAGRSSEVAAAYAAHGLHAVVMDYSERMDLALAAADLAFCRSGASTAAELIHQALPAVLVPYPHAAGGHQLANARWLASAGCSEVLEEAALDETAAAARVSALFAGRLPAMRAAYDRLTVPIGRKVIDSLVSEVESLLP